MLTKERVSLKTEVDFKQQAFQIPHNPIQNSHNTYDQINNYFTEQDQQQKRIQEAREVLGESASSMNDEQVYDLVTEMEYLVDSWVEEFEQSIFDGKTLKEVLQTDL